MNSITIIKRIALRELKQNMYFVFSLICSTASLFIFITLYIYFQTLVYSYAMNIIFICLLFMIILNEFLANRYFLSTQRKTIFSLLLTGRNIFQIAIVLLLQNSLFMLIGIPLGLGIGILVNYSIAMFGLLSSNSFSIINPEVFYFLISVVIMKCIYYTMIDVSYIYKTNLKALLEINTKLNILEIKKRKIPPIVVYFIFILLYFGCWFIPASISNINGVLVCLFIIFFIFCISTLPKVLENIKMKKEVPHKNVVLIGNFYQSFQYSSFYIIEFYGCLFLTNILLLVNYQNNVYAFIIISISVIFFVLMSNNLFYKFIMDTRDRRRLYVTLYKVGYTINNIKQLMRQEYYLYFILLILPFTFFITIYHRLFQILQQRNLNFLFFSGIYVFIIIGMLLLSYGMCKNKMIKQIKGEIQI